MSPNAAFGDLLLETDIDQTLMEVLSLWVPSYLTVIENERGLASHFLPRPAPGSYAAVLDDDGFPDNRLPCVLITTASLQDVEENGNGEYDGSWGTTVTVIARGQTPTGARYNASLYGGCVRRILPSQDNDINAMVKFTGGQLGLVADVGAEKRHLAASMSFFTVWTDHLLYVGPNTPNLDPEPYEPPDPDGAPDVPYDDLVQVTEVTVDVQGVAITDTLGG